MRASALARETRTFSSAGSGAAGAASTFRQRLPTAPATPAVRDGDDFDGAGRLGQRLGQHRLIERDGSAVACPAWRSPRGPAGSNGKA